MIFLLAVGLLSFFTESHAIDSDLIENYLFQSKEPFSFDGGQKHFGNLNEPYGKAITKGILVDSSFGTLAGDGLISEDGIDSGEELKDAISNLDLDYYPFDIYHPHINDYYGLGSSANFHDYGHSLLGDFRQPLLLHPPGSLNFEGSVDQGEILNGILESIKLLGDSKYVSILQNTDLSNKNKEVFQGHQLFQGSTFPRSPFFPLGGSQEYDAFNIRRNVRQKSSGIVGGSRIPKINDLLPSLNIRNEKTLRAKLGIAGDKRSRLTAGRESKLRGTGLPEGKISGITGNFGNAKVNFGNNFIGQRKFQGNSGNPYSYRNKGATATSVNPNLPNSLQYDRLNRNYDSSYSTANFLLPQFFVKPEDSPEGKDLLFNQSFDNYDDERRSLNDAAEVGVFIRKSDFRDEDPFSRSSLIAVQLQEDGNEAEGGGEVSQEGFNVEKTESRNNQNLDEEKEEGESESSEEK